MRVLVVTNMYPTDQFMYDGIFVKEQVDQLRLDNVEVDVLIIKTRGDSFFAYLTGILKVRKRVKEKYYDIVHFHYGLTAFSSLGVLDIPVVVTFHGSDLDIAWQRIISLLAGIRADKVITQNKKHARLFRKKTSIIPCGINTDFFTKVKKFDAKATLGLDQNKKYILFPANPSNKIKNYSLYSKIISELKKTDDAIEELVLHNVQRNTVGLYYCAAECCVLTSYHESGPIVTKEALFLDCPIFSVDVGDVKMVLGTLSEKFIISRDAFNAAQKIRDYLMNNNVHEFSFLVKDYTRENISKKIIHVYSSLVDGKI